MVLGLGYNGLASGKNVAAAFWKDRDERRKYMIHAEVNCLSLFKRDEAEILAVTTLPCSSCAAMIVSYGIKRVIYEEDYKRDDVALEIFKFYKIEFKKINIRNKRLT
jgi:dCMP deaminase